MSIQCADRPVAVADLPRALPAGRLGCAAGDRAGCKRAWRAPRPARRTQTAGRRRAGVGCSVAAAGDCADEPCAHRARRSPTRRRTLPAAETCRPADSTCAPTSRIARAAADHAGAGERRRHGCARRAPARTAPHDAGGEAAQVRIDRQRAVRDGNLTANDRQTGGKCLPLRRRSQKSTRHANCSFSCRTDSQAAEEAMPTPSETCDPVACADAVRAAAGAGAARCRAASARC